MQKINLFLLIVFLCGCGQKAPAKNLYSREETPYAVQRLAKQEFNLGIKTNLTKNSLWVYFPSEKLLDSNFNLREEAGINLDHINMVIGRVILNSINPPEFYVLVASDIKTVGADYTAIVYTVDLKRYYYSRISRGDFSKRKVSSFSLNLMALNDWEGNHVLPNDISLQQFLTEQLRLRLEDKLRENSLKQPVTTKSVEADFRNNRFIFKLDFKKTSASADIDIIPEALKIISWVLRDYAFRDFSEVEISETSTGKNIIVSQKTLFEDFR